MSTALNLYATKVFAEHPVSLWALDDTSDYVALINDTNQNLDNWSVTGASVVDARTDSEFQSDRPPLEPFENKYLNGVTETLGSGGIVTFESPGYFQPSDFDLTLGSFSISTYFFTYDRTTQVRVGYSYFNGSQRVEVPDVTRATTIPVERQWASISQTFDFPSNFSDLKIFIEVSFTESASPYKFSINGINVGQLAEEFFLESPGVLPASLSSEINLQVSGVPAQPYGLEGASGYYLSDNKKMYAKNLGMPIVYGAYNSTVLTPFANNPSLIVPGLGFLNESGQYQKFTFEFWAKIHNESFVLRKIFGPVFSEDGLYTEGPFLILKIGKEVGSHYIGEWNRPMLFNIRYSPDSCSLVLNGEEVISFSINPNDTTFPNKEDGSGNDQDWLGFYAYEDIPIISLDCTGLYPYEVPAIVSKRRFVYGQAVEVPSNLQGFKKNNSLSIDNAFAKHAKTYSYPLLGNWSNAIVENLVPNPSDISSPSYSLPEIAFDNKTVEEWYQASSNSQVGGYSFFSMEPDAEWTETNGHMYFNSLENILEETKAIYGVFSLKRLYQEKQILIEMVNKVSGDSLEISVTDNTVNYILKTKQPNGSFVEENIFTVTGLVADAIFLAGIHIPRAKNSFGYKLSRFFTNISNISVFLCGNSELQNTFRGRVHSVGFPSKRNLKKIEDDFLIIGMPSNFSENYTEILIYDGGEYDTIEWEYSYESGTYAQEANEVSLIGNESGSSAALLVATQVYDHISTYTLIPKDYFGAFTLDIGAESYWEDYLPLSYFAKYVTDGAGNQYKDLDFIQFNIDYPFFNKYLNNFYDSTDSPVKMYASFEYLVNGVATQLSAYTNTKLLPKSGIVRPGTEWKTTKYEITDDTVIYPPAEENFESLALKISLEISTIGVIEKPISIKSLDFASKSLGYSPNRIGNRFGTEVYPYRKVGPYFDYKNVPPFSIYKNSVPYLYLSGSSGIRMRDDYATSDERGFTMPINRGRGSFFKVGSMQILAKYERDTLPTTPVKIFEIDGADRSINFYLVAFKGNSKRGFVYALDGTTGRAISGLIYSMDGRNVKRPIISPNVWTAIGVSFEEAIDFSSSVGALRITNPIFVDNISYYQITEQEESSRLAYRKWYAVRAEPDNDLDWDYWDESTWQEVLFLTEARPTVIDPTKIYKQYTGTDRFVNQSSTSIRLGEYKYSTFKNVRWSRITSNSA